MGQRVEAGLFELLLQEADLAVGVLEIPVELVVLDDLLEVPVVRLLDAKTEVADLLILRLLALLSLLTLGFGLPQLLAQLFQAGRVDDRAGAAGPERQGVQRFREGGSAPGAEAGRRGSPPLV